MKLFDNYDRLLWLCDVLGENATIESIKNHFITLRCQLASSDVTFLYDEKYVELVRSHPIVYQVSPMVGINKYQFPAYKYITNTTSVSDRKVLDIGCGFGNFVVALAINGFLAIGIDNSPMMIRHAEELSAKNAVLFAHHPIFYCGDLSSEFERERFDFVTLNDVVEHLSRDEVRTVLARCRSLLKPNGEVIIHTPNGKAVGWDMPEKTLRGMMLWFLVKHVLRRLYTPSLKEAYYYQAHINVMSCKTIARLGREAGFSRISCQYDEPSPVGIWSDIYSPDMTVFMS